MQATIAPLKSRYHEAATMLRPPKRVTGDEAQMLLSYVVFPEGAPAPWLVERMVELGLEQRASGKVRAR